MKAEKVIPILRIFDYQKTIEFYIDWLGFEIVWEHHFEENTPVYMEVKKDNITLHLSEHHGDGTPGSRVFIWGEGIPDYHKELNDKKYKYNRPGLGKTFYDALALLSMILSVIRLFLMKNLMRRNIRIYFKNKYFSQISTDHSSIGTGFSPFKKLKTSYWL